MSPRTTGESIRAIVEIGGNSLAPIAIGENIVQVTGDNSVLNVIAGGELPRVELRPRPVQSPPHALDDALLDRAEAETSALAAMQRGRMVVCSGLAGIGKTSLLRHLAHFPTLAIPRDGIVGLMADQPIDDILQELFDLFYEAEFAYKPRRGELRGYLRELRALILLDEADLEQSEVELLQDLLPHSALVLASLAPPLGGSGEFIALDGLPLDAALTLLGRGLRRPLQPEEDQIAREIVATLGYHPRRLFLAGTLARTQAMALPELMHQLQVGSPDALLIATLSPREAQGLSALATLRGARVDIPLIARLTGEVDVAPTLNTLIERGLVQKEQERYGVVGGVVDALDRTDSLADWKARALATLTTWAEEQWRRWLETPPALRPEDERTAPRHLRPLTGALLALLGWAVAHAHWAEALRLTRALDGPLTLSGHWGAWGRALELGLQAAEMSGDEAAAAWARHQLGTRAGGLGDLAEAREFLTRALELREKLGDRAGAAVTRHNLRLVLGGLPPPGPEPTSPIRQPISPLRFLIDPQRLRVLGRQGVRWLGRLSLPTKVIVIVIVALLAGSVASVAAGGTTITIVNDAACPPLELPTGSWPGVTITQGASPLELKVQAPNVLASIVTVEVQGGMLRVRPPVLVGYGQPLASETRRIDIDGRIIFERGKPPTGPFKIGRQATHVVSIRCH